MLRVRTVMTGLQGAPYYNTLYCGGSTEGEAQAAAIAVAGFWDDAPSGQIASGLTIRVDPEVEIVDVASGQVTASFTQATDPVTTSGGEGISPASQGLIRLRTGVFTSGRELRGRIFIPQPGTAFNVEGAPSSAYVSGLQGSINATLTALTGAGGLGVYSTAHRVFSQVTTADPWNQWAVLRSRRD